MAKNKIYQEKDLERYVDRRWMDLDKDMERSIYYISGTYSEEFFSARFSSWFSGIKEYFRAIWLCVKQIPVNDDDNDSLASVS